MDRKYYAGDYAVTKDGQAGVYDGYIWLDPKNLNPLRDFEPCHDENNAYVIELRRLFTELIKYSLRTSKSMVEENKNAEIKED